MKVIKLKKRKKLLSILTLLTFLINSFFILNIKVKADETNLEVKTYDDVREKDLSNMDFTGKSDLLFTLTFDTNTKWPSKDKMPEDFDPSKLMEQGKNPGLNIRKLQQEGYAGKGITIAYIDQHILLNHEAYKNVNLHNYEIQNDGQINPSMHGPAVLSLLAGKDEGIVPDAEVYFFGHNGMKDDNEYEARAFEKIIELNKTLPDNKKIKIVGMSHGADDSLSQEYAKHLRDAQDKARKSGIIVVDVSCGMATCGVSEFKDRDDYLNYQISNWEKPSNESFFNNKLFVPADFRTTAEGYKNDPKQYAYWGSGGFSWGVPYITGVITMALQINPNLTESEAFKYLYKSGYDFNGGKLINPEGFISMVKQNCTNPHDVSQDKDYRYFLYNKNKVSSEDLQFINNYLSKFNDGTVNILKDVSDYNNAADIYQMLKLDSQSRTGDLKGIQIFGTSDDVPAFGIHYKIQMHDSIDDSGNFNSDFFYSSFKSDVSSLKNDLSIYKTFNDKLDVNFIPDWPVVRLPLTKGEIAPYMQRVQDYVSQASNMSFGNFVNFSNPIFAEKNHSDDMSYFIKERLDKEFNILNSNEYRLYGNKQGAYPVQTDVIGDYTKDNIGKENKDGIKEFIINDHGQWDNIDQCIYTTEDKSSEKRVSFLNMDTINSVLSNNYYDLDLWTCLNAYNLSGNNLVHQAMNSGKCISAMAASSTISNNGVHNDASLENMKKNNFYYFYLNYFYNRANGESRSNSFNLAQKAYAREILKNTDMLMDGNYQFNLHNLLSYHYLGLIEYWNYNGKSNFNPKLDDSTGSSGDTPDDSNNQNTFDGNVKFSTNYSGGGFKVDSFKAERNGDNIEFTLNYESSRNCDYSFFNPPNGDKIMKIVNGGIIQGNNTTKFSISMDEFNKILSVDSMTMIFGFDDKQNFISFNTSQLKSLLSSSGGTTKSINDNDFVLLKESKDVDENKDWIISFKGSVDEESLDSSKIFVLDENNKIVNVNLVLNPDNDKQVIVKHITSYTSGKTYKLYITKDVQSKKNQNLVRAILFKFTIK